MSLPRAVQHEACGAFCGIRSNEVPRVPPSGPAPLVPALPLIPMAPLIPLALPSLAKAFQKHLGVWGARIPRGFHKTVRAHADQHPQYILAMFISAEVVPTVVGMVPSKAEMAIGVVGVVLSQVGTVPAPLHPNAGTYDHVRYVLISLVAPPSPHARGHTRWSSME